MTKYHPTRAACDRARRASDRAHERAGNPIPYKARAARWRFLAGLPDAPSPADRKRAFAQFIRSHGHCAMIGSDTGALIAYIRGTSYTWRNCPTFRQVRVALGLPVEYIALTEVES